VLPRLRRIPDNAAIVTLLAWISDLDLIQIRSPCEQTALNRDDLPARQPVRSTQEQSMETSQAHDEKIPMMQKLLDNPFLLLFIGVLVPMVVYILWGVIDILTIPLAK
jgi:hypothetical protein